MKPDSARYKTKLILIIATLCLYACGVSRELSLFKSDGCSAFPDGTPEANTLWLSCCTAHDLAYWQGGTYQQRLQADNDLQACVAQTGQEEIANLMLAGVRIGGTPYLPTTFRWGYGWAYPRSYKAQTPEEQALVQQRIQSF